MTADKVLATVVSIIKFHLKPSRLSDEELQTRAGRILVTALRGPIYRMTVIMELAQIYTDGTQSDRDTDAAETIRAAAEDIYARIL